MAVSLEHVCYQLPQYTAESWAPVNSIEEKHAVLVKVKGHLLTPKHKNRQENQLLDWHINCGIIQCPFFTSRAIFANSVIMPWSTDNNKPCKEKFVISEISSQQR